MGVERGGDGERFRLSESRQEGGCVLFGTDKE